MAKVKFDYFNAFTLVTGHAVRYVEEIVEYFESHYDAEAQTGSLDQAELLQKLDELHAIEDESDQVLQDILEHLLTEFIAPIEREDILLLSEELDTIVDELDDVLQSAYMYNVKVITPEMIDMIHVVQKVVLATHEACERFSNLKKNKSIKKYIREIHALEDEGDMLYIKSVHNIYKNAEDGAFEHPLMAVGVANVLSMLEKCCDSCESAADIMVTIRLKNS